MNGSPVTEVISYKFMKIYKVSFKSMSELYMYLSDDPPINRNVFVRQHSILGNTEFAGEPYEKALDYCLGGYEGDYKVVMKMQKEKTIKKEAKKKIIRSNIIVIFF